MIEDRLGGIEKALRELLISSRLQRHTQIRPLASSQASFLSKTWTRSSASKPPTQLESSEKGPSYSANPAIEQCDPSSGFETNSSLAAHSAYAKEFLESAVCHSTPEILSSPKISEALSSLRRLVEMQSKRVEPDPQRNPFPSQNSRTSPQCDIRELEMPPLPVVLNVLRKVKGMSYANLRREIFLANSSRKSPLFIWWLPPLLYRGLFH